MCILKRFFGHSLTLLSLLMFSVGIQAQTSQHYPCHEKEIEEINAVVQEYLHQHSTFSSPVSLLYPQCFSAYASAILHPAEATTDDAVVYLHEVNDQWEVLTIGTHFDMDFLSKIPKEVRVLK